MIKKWYILVIIILSVAGIILSGVLTLAKYNDNIAQLCGEDVGNSCNVVQNSEYAYLINVKDDATGQSTFQIPLSLAGVFFYLILLIISLVLYFNFTQAEYKKLHWIMFVVGLCGIAMSLFLTWIQAYKLEAFCKYCIVSAAESLILFFFISLIAFDDRIEKIKTKRKSKKKTKN